MDPIKFTKPVSITEKDNSITYLNLTSFLIIYIILFSYIFVKKYEIVTFILLSVFHGLFTIMIIHLLSTYPLSKMNYLTGSIWTSIFTSMILTLVSLTFLLSTYKYFDDKYTQFGKPIPFTKNIIDMINNYKILIITTISLIIFMLFILVGYTPDLNVIYNTLKDNITLDNIKYYIYQYDILYLLQEFNSYTQLYKVPYINNFLNRFLYTNLLFRIIIPIILLPFNLIYTILIRIFQFIFYIFLSIFRISQSEFKLSPTMIIICYAMVFFFLELFNLAIITMSSYGIKMSNDFMLYKQYTYAQ